ncbi:hypothetical protein EON79_01765 [bacterium]|nr:MAG: hypothetical protein EON79_01765 [bacterium]
MSERGKVYSEKQTAEILQRAAKLQEGEEPNASASGLSHEEVLRAAAELGIAPENVESVMAAMERKGSRGFFGATQTETRVVNVELDPGKFDVILEVARPTQSRHRAPGQIGRTLSVRTRHKGAMYRVDVVSRDGRTQIEVTSVPVLAFLMTLYPALLISFFGGASIGAEGVNVLALLFAFFVLATGLIAFAALVGRANGHTAELADTIEKQVREATSAASVGLPILVEEERQTVRS